MALSIHIILAVLSLLFGSFVAILPTLRRQRVNYGLVAFTLASGAYLVLTTHSNMLQACWSGLFYLVIVTMLAARARYVLLRSNRSL